MTEIQFFIGALFLTLILGAMLGVIAACLISWHRERKTVRRPFDPTSHSGYHKEP